MKKVWIIILAVLNLIAFGLILSYYCWFFSALSIQDAFTWGLPWLIAALLSLVSGILTLTKKKWGCGFAGFFLALIILFIYFLILLTDLGTQ